VTGLPYHSRRIPPGVHVPIMVGEVRACLAPAPGDVVVDATFGGGGHARALLPHIQPGGRLLGLDVDASTLADAEAALRAEGWGTDTLAVRHANFARLGDALRAEGLHAADIILADLGVSAMQFDAPARGFSYKGVGPLDMRLDGHAGEPASALLRRLPVDALADLLSTNADEPHAAGIAAALHAALPLTTHAAEKVVRAAVLHAVPDAPRSEVKASVRRTFQALRIAVNDEFGALDAFLAALPACLAPGGRVAVLTFHSGEDRRVKHAFAAGVRAGVYSAVADRVVRSAKAETFANRRAAAAKLRWARRAR
jgi:16S rRNA (cytosine1402-N4)-methyltransferase